MNERLLEHIRATKIFADETTAPVLEKTKVLFLFPVAARLKTGCSDALLLAVLGGGGIGALTSGRRATGALAGAAIGAASGAAVGVDSACAGRVPAASALRTLEQLGRCLLLRCPAGHASVNDPSVLCCGLLGAP